MGLATVPPKMAVSPDRYNFLPPRDKIFTQPFGLQFVKCSDFYTGDSIRCLSRERSDSVRVSRSRSVIDIREQIKRRMRTTPKTM